MAELEKLSRNELYELARTKNIKGRSKMSRDELIRAIEEATNTEQLVTKSKYDIAHNKTIGYEEATPSPTSTIKQHIEEEYKIPENYNIDMLMFLPIDPRRAYVCWEVTKSRINEFIKNIDINSFRFKLKLFTIETGVVSSVEVGSHGNYFFINEMLEDKEAWAEIGVEDHSGFHCLLKSNSFKMPAEHISERDDALYMTVRSKVEKIIRMSLHGLERYYSSIELYKSAFKMVSSKNNSEWR
jgi:hypothetical protein